MATTIAQLEARLDANTRGFDRGMGKSESTFSKIGRNIGKIALGMGVAVGVGLAVGAKKAVTAASNLEEQVNKTSVVFEKSGSQVVKWSGTLTKSFGLSSRAALEAAGTYGNMLKPMGIAPGLAAKLSMNMVELAGDMASFNNASPEETLDALRAGLAGETEPLRRFGVFLNEARIREEALSMGLIKTTDKVIPPAVKAQASYNLIMKDTADTQGDFARTSKSLPNLLRTIRATVENLAARIGAKLLPIVAQVVEKFSDLLDFLDRFAKAGSADIRIRVIWEGLKELGTDLFETIEKVLMGSAGRLKPLKLDGGKIIEFQRVGASSGLVKSLQEMFEAIDWARIGARIGAAIGDAIEVSNEWVGRAFEAANEWVDSHSDELADTGAKMVLKMIETLLDPAFWKDNWKLILGIAVSVFPLGRFASLGGKAGGMLGRAFARVVPGLLVKPIVRAIDEIGHQFRRLPAIVQEPIRMVGRLVVRMLTGIVRYLEGKFREAWAKVGPWIRAAFRVGALVVFATWMQNIIDKVRDLIEWIGRIDFPDAPDWLSLDRLPSLPFNVRGAAGGIVTRPTLSWIGEGGPEAVIPLNRTPGSSPLPALAGGGPVVFNNYGFIGTSEREFMRWLDRAQEKRSRRGG